MLFHLKESTSADLAAVATAVTELEARTSVFTAPSASWYRQQGVSLQSLLEDAPLVRIEFQTKSRSADDSA